MKAGAEGSEPENLATRARRAIEDAILSGRLLPGQVLDEREWATRLGISRTPVREAIRDLTAPGPRHEPAAPARLCQPGRRIGTLSNCSRR